MNKDNIVKIFKIHFKLNLVEFLILIFLNITFGMALNFFGNIENQGNIFLSDNYYYFLTMVNSFLRISIKKNEKELYLSSGCKRNEINFVMFVFQFLSSLILWISYIIATLLFLNILKISTIEYFSLNFRNFSIFISMAFLLSTISFNAKESNKKWFLKEYIELLFVILILLFMVFIVDNIPSFEIKLNVLISIAVYFLSIVISYIIGKEFMNKKDFV